MWLFDEQIAALRRTNDFFVKIEQHSDSEVAGRREGKVLSDPNAPTHPIPTSSPATVRVLFEIKKKNETRVEELPASSLAITTPKVKRRHAVIRGDRKGEVVIYLKSDRDRAQVHEEHLRKNISYISKSDLCCIEKML